MEQVEALKGHFYHYVIIVYIKCILLLEMRLLLGHLEVGTG